MTIYLDENHREIERMKEENKSGQLVKHIATIITLPLTPADQDH